MPERKIKRKSAGRQAGKQADKQTGRQADKQTGTDSACVFRVPARLRNTAPTPRPF